MKNTSTPENKAVENDDEYSPQDRSELTSCPWCSSIRQSPWGKEFCGFVTVKCPDCDLIYVKNCLNEQGLRKYYKRYLSRRHRADEEVNRKRSGMYRLDFEYVDGFVKEKTVLDVGCGGGYFLDLFKADGYETFGVEFGEEAAGEASKKHRVLLGSFPDLEIKPKFDLVIFRGVIEHVTQPKEYLRKAISVLKENGMVFITATPNGGSFCCNLYKEKWNQHDPEQHIFHFSEKHFDHYFQKNGLRKLSSHFFYEETPYADTEEDILHVADAIRKRRSGEDIDTMSPAFWGNMLSVIYGKQGK